ncbi:peptidase M48 family protein [Mycobacterium kansasii 662]|uniref:Peptidase M48 family protein n=1 Tax=Mycobacterium kansasii 662 TaxID=1299326 RepID=X7ZIX8_MYCKA|nr:M48 family metallopeptidase [Mycobacterium kansasii]EUA18996.1 peptidase M48 family protein [Mycobacterium kansasii 662]
MNFFDHQRAARSSTLKLVLLFIVAVVAMVAFIDAAAAVAMTYQRADPSAVLGVVVGVTAVTLLIIAGGMITKTVALRQGGAAVAASVGAVQVDPTSSDPQLRRLVNIVEEMSLASGVPAPRLFVLAGEPGINAFAAGFTPADAAITVTSGALAQLNRDELQGVIAHEFSHILNGDMRLNIRLIGLLNGILLIGLTGMRVLQFGGGRGSSSKNGAPIWMVALAMMVLGFIGVFFANIIKAAVSRQREWLADASAVQFTRQTAGLVGALKKIAGVASGSALRDARSATEVSHMLFGEGRRSFRAWYATHPPLADRIKALDPSFDPREIADLKQRYGQRSPDGLAEDAMAGFAPVGRAAGVRAGAEPAAAPAGPLGRVGVASAPSRWPTAPARSPGPTCCVARRCTPHSHQRRAAWPPSPAPPRPRSSPCCWPVPAIRCMRASSPR